MLLFFFKRKCKDFTSDSSAGELMYLRMKPMIQPTLFVLSTAHFRFFMMGASPVAFSKISTEITNVFL